MSILLHCQLIANTCINNKANSCRMFKGTVYWYCLSEWSHLSSLHNQYIPQVIRIYSNKEKYVKLLWTSMFESIIAWTHGQHVCQVLLCPFTMLLYHISNTFAPVNADIVRQEICCDNSYIIVGCCPCSVILIVCLVNYCTVMRLHSCMGSIPMNSPFKHAILAMCWVTADI